MRFPGPAVGSRFWLHQSSRIALALASGFAAQPALADAVIDNGTVQLGILDTGNLIISPGIGLTYLPTSAESLAPGCYCEGWGIADLGVIGSSFAVSQSNGSSGAGTATGVVGGTGTDAASAGSTFLSTTNITVAGNPWAEVVQDFAPSPTANLYQVDVTISNIGGLPITNLVFRRVMDWDVPPTEFSEFVTIQGWPAAALIASSDDGFEHPDPNVATLGSIVAPVDSNFSDSGPADHGAAFDFSFGTLAAGGTVNFTIYYGAAGTIDDAMAALGAVGAEVYSLGYPNDGAGGANPTGTPNVFIFAFAGVGGTPVGPGIGPASDLELLRAIGIFAAQHVLDDPMLRMSGLFNGGDPENSQGSSALEGLRFIATGGFASSKFTTQAGAAANHGFFHGGFAAERTFTGGGFESARAGVGVNFGRATGSLDTDTTINANTITLYGYGGANFANGAYVDGVVGYSWLDYDWTRLASLGGYNASMNGGQISGLVRAGIDRPIETKGALSGTLTGGVFASLQGTHNSIGSFTETSATLPGGSAIAGQGVSAFAGRLGARATYQQRMQNGMLMTTMLWGAYERQHIGGATVSVNGSSLVLPSIDRDIGRIGARFSAQISEQSTMSAEYEGAFGSNSFRQHNFAARLKVKF